MTIRPIIAALAALMASACATYGDGYNPYYDNAYGNEGYGWYVGPPVGGYAYSYDPFYDASYYALYGYGWTPSGYYALHGHSPYCYNPGFGPLYANPCGYGYGYGYAGLAGGPGYGYWNNFFLFANVYGNNYGYGGGYYYDDHRDHDGDRKKKKKKKRNVRDGGPNEWDDAEFARRRANGFSTAGSGFQRSPSGAVVRSNVRSNGRFVAPSAGTITQGVTTQGATIQGATSQPRVQSRGQPRVQPRAQQRSRPSATSSGPRPRAQSAPKSTQKARSRSNNRGGNKSRRSRNKN